MIRLGQNVRDVVTGFTGIVTGQVDYLTGCRQCLVVPPLQADGKLGESHWFDITRLTLVDDEVIELPAFEYEAPARLRVSGADSQAPKDVL